MVCFVVASAFHDNVAFFVLPFTMYFCCTLSKICQFVPDALSVNVVTVSASVVISSVPNTDDSSAE